MFDESDELHRNLVKNADLPNFWPALSDLLIDDKNRIWVSIIIDEQQHEWWVLNNKEELLARFYWPMNEPIKVVKNGYIYTRDTDEETGLQQIVRYRIEMEDL